MDSISTAELLELALLARSSVDDQFQYWITITFAVIVASFAADEKLNRNWRLTISLLYLLTTGLFFTRYYADAQHFLTLISAFAERGGEWPTSYVPALGALRIFVYVAGTALALSFLNGGVKSDSNDH